MVFVSPNLADPCTSVRVPVGALHSAEIAGLYLTSRRNRDVAMLKKSSPALSAAATGALRLTRRRLLTGAACLGLGSTAAQAQDADWLKSIWGGNRAASADSTAKSERVADPLNDLRADAVPMRSDQMLDNVEAAIARYSDIVARGGWPVIPPGPMLRNGDEGERVALLRRRLMASGDLSPRGGNNSSSFDDTVETAMRTFQERHGLRVTGRMEQSMIAALNITANTRLEQLKRNQRRLMDLMQGRVEDRYILVNAAAFQLEAVEGFEVRQRHRTIVGKPERQTPEIKATIRAVNFFPYWNVPESVATLDLIPKLRKEPEYLTKELIRAYNGFKGPELDPMATNWNTADGKIVKFRQDPGPQNALGLVRIDMPNSETVYMHDTPMKPLFKQRSRPFSAGCVRVEDVFKLVEWIARHEVGWDKPGRVADVLGAGQPLDVTLTRPIPVYFAYITAWAEASGRVEFRPDIYGRDGLAKDNVIDPDAPPPPVGSIAALAP
jgi:L,D-transpeptidase YcbB